MGYRTRPKYCRNQDTKFVVVATVYFILCETAATLSINPILEGEEIMRRGFVEAERLKGEQLLLDKMPWWIRHRVA